MYEQYVESFFASIPYSEEAFKAKAAIIEALGSDPEVKDGDFETLVKKYPDLRSLAALAGFSGSEVEELKSTHGLVSREEAQKSFKKTRRNSYLLMIPLALVIAYAAYFLFYLHPYHLIVCALLVGLTLLVRKKRPAVPSGSLSLEAYGYTRDIRDKYVKKLINTVFGGLGVTALLIYTGLMLGSNNSKPSEMFEFVVSNFFYIEVFMVLLGKNRLLTVWANRLLADKRNHASTRCLALLAGAISALYWAVVLVMFKLFNTTNVITFYIAVGIFALIALAFNLTLRKKVTFRNLRVNKLRVAVVSLLVLAIGGYAFLQKDVWLTQPYINTVANIHERSDTIAYAEYEDGTGVYTLTNNNDDETFRILQLTDIHLGGSITSYPNDIKALKACFELIRAAQPDLVVVTGDLSYPVGISSFSINNTAPVMQFASFMRNMGVPWAFTYGNHDTEAMAATGKESLNDIYMSLSYKTSKNLLYPYSQPVAADGSPIMGRNNQVIELRNRDGSLCSALFLIDSNAYAGEGFSKYDYIRDDQVDWYESHVKRLNEEAGKTVTSLAFFHIPVTQYKTAYEMYLAGSDEVKYFFGENREGGKVPAKICCTDTAGRFFDSAVELGSTKGFFCGHDHYNNMSLEYKGVRLTYGMSIDYLVEPGIVNKTAQRGATLILHDKDGGMSLSQIPYEGLKTDES